GPRIVEPLVDPGVARVDRVEQEERRRLVARELPDLELDFRRENADRHPHSGVLEEIEIRRRIFVDRHRVGPDGLRGVSLLPENADRHHRHVEVVRALHVVAGEDAQSAGVDRKLLVAPVLHAEVRDARIVAGASLASFAVLGTGLLFYALAITRLDQALASPGVDPTLVEAIRAQGMHEASWLPMFGIIGMMPSAAVGLVLLLVAMRKARVAT